MPSIHQFVCSFHRLHSAVCGCMQHFASTIPARHTHHTYIYKYIPLTSFAIHSYSWCLTSHECVELVFIFIIFWHSHQCHWSKCIQTFARLYCVCVFAPACRAFRIQQKSIFRSCVHTIDRRGTGVYRTNEHIQCKHKHTHITHALGPFIAVTHAIQLRVVPFGSRLIFLTPPSLALALAALNFHSLCEIHACRRDSIVWKS